jgi:polysaccharide biosynthesis transport protein
VTKELGLEIIGALPTIRIGNFNTPEEASQVVEAFRAIRLSVRHAYQSSGPVMMTISSPGPGDGKSLVSSNLALSFAEAGYRTILIDGDIRRGEMHRTFNVEPRPGLLDYLVGEATKEQIVRTTSHDNLMLVPRGARRHRGPELLASEAMLRLLASFRSEYDVIISDSPPLGAGIDPFALGTATGNMLLVVRAGETDRKMAQAKLALLERLPVRILGVVLNSIRAEGVYRYYSYIEGYETVTDEDAPSLDTHIGELTAKN